MIEAAAEVNMSYYPLPVATEEASWRVAAYHHLFGSEELSQRSQVIQERMPQTYVMLSANDAATLKVEEGDKVVMNCADETLTLRAKISPHLQAGWVGLPLGLPDVPPVLSGQIVTSLRREE